MNQNESKSKKWVLPHKTLLVYIKLWTSMKLRFFPRVCRTKSPDLNLSFPLLCWQFFHLFHSKEYTFKLMFCSHFPFLSAIHDHLNYKNSSKWMIFIRLQRCPNNVEHRRYWKIAKDLHILDSWDKKGPLLWGICFIGRDAFWWETQVKEQILDCFRLGLHALLWIILICNIWRLNWSLSVGLLFHMFCFSSFSK